MKWRGAGARAMAPWLALIAPVWLGLGTVGAAETLDLAALRRLGDFEVQVAGAPHAAFVSGRRCVYFEWTYGEMGPEGWEVRWGGHHSGQPLTVVTPRGPLELRFASLRLYLAPTERRRFARTDAHTAPAPVRERLVEADRPITVEEYLLEPERRYYARVETETYFLPPAPGTDKPSRRRNHVLALSDLPFKNGRPQRALTPAYQGITY